MDRGNQRSLDRHHRAPHGQTGTHGPLLAALLCLGLCGLVVVMDAVTGPPGQSLTREGGGIETLSALLYLLAGWAFVVRGAGRLRLWPVPLLLLAMAAREFDFDKRFTSEGLLGTKLLASDAPLLEKLLGLGVTGTLIFALGVLALRAGSGFIRAFKGSVDWALFVAAGLLLMVVSKSIDGLARKLAPLGIDLPGGAVQAAAIAEEVMELGIPIFFLMAILSRFAPERC